MLTGHCHQVLCTGQEGQAWPGTVLQVRAWPSGWLERPPTARCTFSLLQEAAIGALPAPVRDPRRVQSLALPPFIAT